MSFLLSTIVEPGKSLVPESKVGERIFLGLVTSYLSLILGLEVLDFFIPKPIIGSFLEY